MSLEKEPIKLRKRPNATGTVSLYLDIYVDGKRTYEWLKLYLVPEKTRKDKAKNEETIRLAQAIRAKRIVELKNGKFGFDSQYATNTRFSTTTASRPWTSSWARRTRTSAGTSIPTAI